METDQVRQRLEAERERLREVAADVRREMPVDGDELGAQELSVVDQHPADIATEVFEREKYRGLLTQVEGELADVERALARLEAGQYGRCEVCGAEIPDERLEEIPAARYCLKHQVEAEGGFVTS